ncbi:hypothetical protein Sjap_014740 [Stephania japonica]|uniref:Uncharacterized protein n=1 Tax=Stephania japonica TaxID=461633 RepID=A0AAP0NQQ8_9MAGN
MPEQVKVVDPKQIWEFLLQAAPKVFFEQQYLFVDFFSRIVNMTFIYPYLLIFDACIMDME